MRICDFQELFADRQPTFGNKCGRAKLDFNGSLILDMDGLSSQIANLIGEISEETVTMFIVRHALQVRT